MPEDEKHIAKFTLSKWFSVSERAEKEYL